MVTVQVCGDTTFETNETFFVNLSNPSNATISDGQGLGTITNDDAKPSLSINDVAQSEGDAGLTPFIFTVSLTGSTALVTTVDFATANGTATGGAACTGSTDYISQNGTLTFPAGTTSQMVIVQVCGDNGVELDETFFVNLSNATNATISDSQGQGTIQNDDFAPVISAITVTPEPSKEGEEVTVKATFTDADDLAGFACMVNFGDGTTAAGVVTPNVGGSFTCTSMHTYLDDGSSPGNGTPQDTYTITVTVTDPGGNTGIASANHVVQNVAPSITLIAVAPNPAASGTPVTVTATFTDPGTLDAHTCTINWGDGTTTSGTVSPPTGSGTCTGTHTYTAAGVLTITVTVTDDDGGSDTDMAFITLIGLNEKVTGGGFIKQPVGAVPDKGGTAYFGFNAKQHVGDTVPTGETNFRYRPGNLDFHSTSYEALVVTVTPDPATSDKAEWWGSGTINGTGDYCFKVNVTDAGEPGKNDSFRIRIWQKVTGTTCSVPAAVPPLLLYDNGFATQSETTLGGGNIQIHLALNVVGGAVRGEPSLLEENALNRIVTAAIARWSSAGVDAQTLSSIRKVAIKTADLPDALLGVVSSGIIWIDRDAAGHGWFIDPCPADENEFDASGSSLIGDRIDLLTVVAHELGHLLGLDHSADSVMREALEPGTRRVPRLQIRTQAVKLPQPGADEVPTRER
jgi:hypothetical protein